LDIDKRTGKGPVEQKEFVQTEFGQTEFGQTEFGQTEFEQTEFVQSCAQSLNEESTERRRVQNVQHHTYDIDQSKHTSSTYVEVPMVT
jgi:hypothetical protein